MTKQFAGGQLARQTSTIHRNKRLIFAATVLVYHAGSVFFSGTAFAQNQNCHFGGSYFQCHFLHGYKGRAFANNGSTGSFFLLFLFRSKGVARKNLLNLIVKNRRIDRFFKKILSSQFDG